MRNESKRLNKIFGNIKSKLSRFEVMFQENFGEIKKIK